MFGSLKLGSVFGITIRVHVLQIVLAIVVFVAEPPQFGALAFAVLCAVVLLHELGHSLVAQRLGIRVVDITLWPLGGISRMNALPESGRVEALIAAAGPIANFALAALGFLALALGPPLDRWNPWVRGAGEQFVLFNLGLGVFNLVPAFPTDGGRILRALLARRHDWLRATEIAVHIGAAVALVCALAGCALVFSSAPFGSLGGVLLVMALFLWWTGRQELAAVRQRHGVPPFAALVDVLRRMLEPRAPAGPARKPEEEGLSDERLAELERYRGSLRSGKRTGS